MTDNIEAMLKTLGYTVSESDSWFIEFAVQKVTNKICNECNTSSIPEGLSEIAVNMAVGEFLFAKKSIGQLNGFDLGTAVKSIQEGDTTVTFAVGDGSMTPEQRLDTLISSLLSCGNNSFSSYRRIKW